MHYIRSSQEKRLEQQRMAEQGLEQHGMAEQMLVQQVRKPKVTTTTLPLSLSKKKVWGWS